MRHFARKPVIPNFHFGRGARQTHAADLVDGSATYWTGGGTHRRISL